MRVGLAPARRDVVHSPIFFFFTFKLSTHVNPNVQRRAARWTGLPIPIPIPILPTLPVLTACEVAYLIWLPQTVILAPSLQSDWTNSEAELNFREFSISCLEYDVCGVPAPSSSLGIAVFPVVGPFDRVHGVPRCGRPRGIGSAVCLRDRSAREGEGERGLVDRWRSRCVLVRFIGRRRWPWLFISTIWSFTTLVSVCAG
jgi:hypothetical protein